MMIWNNDPALIAEINDRMSAYLSPRVVPEPLRSALMYAVDGGGKRLRPLLLLRANACFDGIREEAMPLACALEMIHTYSLIHDDLPAMDNDVMRRGRPTHHVVFGEAMAILTGDALLNLAYELMLEHVPQDSTRAAGYLAAAGTIAHAAGAEGMVAGQCLDMMMEHGQASLEALEQMQRAKTGALFSAAMLGGALAGGAGQAELAAVRDYAEHAGMLFQIVDDILDVVGDEKSLGKSVGKDEQAGKCTYVTMLGLDGARAQAAMHRDQAASFASIFDKEGFFSQFVIDLYQRDQ